MSNEKPATAAPKPKRPDGLWAREVRLKGTIRLPGAAVDWFSVEAEKAKSGRAIVTSLTMTQWGVCIIGGERQFQEPVVNVPWAQIEYWVPA